MAILKGGPNGGFSGKVGSVVGYQWRGKDVIRGLPRLQSKPRSPEQLANQLKMTLTQRFLKASIYFIRVGFKHEADKRTMSAFNLAMSYNKKQAITGEYPELEFDYSKAVMSMGSLAPMRNGAANWLDGGLELRWTNDSGEENASGLDFLLVVAFFPETEQCEYLFNGPSRDKEQAFIPVKPLHQGKSAHIYASFINYMGSDISPSSYLGSV